MTRPGSLPEHPFGEAPEGAIFYTADGWMACQMQGGTISSAYCGPYEVDEATRRVIHRVAFSDSPLMRGDQLRHYQIAENRLLLSADMDETRIEVLWRRP